jgi:hypothetical protein
LRATTSSLKWGNISAKGLKADSFQIFVSANFPPEGGTVLDVLPIGLVGFITNWDRSTAFSGGWQRRTLCNDCDDQTWSFTKKHYDVP